MRRLLIDFLFTFLKQWKYAILTSHQNTDESPDLVFLSTFLPANFVNTGEIQENNKDWGGPRRQKQDAIFVNPAARGYLALQ